MGSHRRSLSPLDIEAIRDDLSKSDAPLAGRAAHAIEQMQEHIRLLADSNKRETALRRALQREETEDEDEDEDG